MKNCFWCDWNNLDNFILVLKFKYLFLGMENYDNQRLFGSKIFEELHTIQENGVRIKGVIYKIDVAHSWVYIFTLFGNQVRALGSSKNCTLEAYC